MLSADTTKQISLATAPGGIRLAISLGIVLSFGIGLTVCANTPALATKLNAKPLPRHSTFERPTKDFAGASQDGQEAMPISLWAGRRPDYRDEAKRVKEEEAKKAEAEKQKQEKAKQDQVNAVKNLQLQAIQLNNEAVMLGRAGRYGEAILKHEQACKIEPSNEEFRRSLSAARCLFAQQKLAKGDATGAAHMFRQAILARQDNELAGKGLSAAIKKMGYDPGIADNRIGLGDQLAAANDLGGATIEYQTAMQLEPGAKTYTKMAEMSIRYGQIPNAVTWYRQAISKDDKYGPAHRGLGFAYMAMRDLTSAASELRKAVIYDQKDLAAGQALVEIWRKQVATHPDLAENHLGLGTALQITGDLDGAEGEYAKVEQLDKLNPQLNPARSSLARARKHKEAEKHREAAETFAGQGLKREALSEMAQAAMMEPNNGQYQFQMGEYLEAAGDYNNALQAYKKSVLIDPKNEEGARRMRELMGKDQRSQQNQYQQQPQQQYQQQATQRPQQLERPGQPDSNQNQGQNNGQQASKYMYEGQAQTNMRGGGSAANSNNEPPPFTGNFRTHEESNSGRPQGMPGKGEIVERPPDTGFAPTQRAQKPNSPILTQAAEYELHGDYQKAVDILKGGLQQNLQDPNIHHRLGLDLVNLGQTSEAISELRIASALDPGNKTYAEDLARVLKIHQRSLSGESR